MMTFRKFLAVFTCFLLALSATSFAKKKQPDQQQPATPFQKIVNVDALSITISIGLSGDNHETYTINDQTKVTLDGAAVNARDLKAGMNAQIETGTDKKVAITITAKNPPANPARKRVG